jgi:hypothetical protein
LSLSAASAGMHLRLESQGKAADDAAGDTLRGGMPDEPARALGKTARAGKNLATGWEN